MSFSFRTNVLVRHATCKTSMQHAKHLCNMQNISATCKTSMQHAKHLSNMQNISATCKTSLQHAKHLCSMQNISATCKTSMQHAKHLSNMQNISATCKTSMQLTRVYNHLTKSYHQREKWTLQQTWKRDSKTSWLLSDSGEVSSNKFKNRQVLTSTHWLRYTTGTVK